MYKLNICYFDNVMGEFNEYNPRFIMEQKYTKDIIDLLSNKKPYYYSNDAIKEKLNSSNNDYNKAISELKNISAIVENDNKLKLNFTFFTSKDIKK